jgi:hypothetical protein
MRLGCRRLMLLNLRDEWCCMNGEGVMPCNDVYLVVVGRLLWKLEVVIGKRKKRNGSEDAVFCSPN